MLKKSLLLTSIAMLLTICPPTYASWFSSIFHSLLRLEGLNSSMLTQQQDIDSLMKQVNGHMTSHAGWGTYQFHDYQSYGEGGADWASVMQMAQSGNGTGALGQTLQGVANQFPIDTATFNQGINSTNAQKYYALQSQTILAERAASQLDYDKIQDQIQYQQMLQQQIEKTQDLKAAMDLSNRIQIEGNLISLEILRQNALANQQQAVTGQAEINNSLTNAKFLTK